MHRTRSALWICSRSRSPKRLSEKVARVGCVPKIRSQCFQIFRKGVQNEPVIAIPRSARSAALLDRQTQPSVRNKVIAGQRTRL